MKTFVVLVLMLFCSSASIAKNNFLIEGYVQGTSDNTSIVLMQYNYEDIIISKTSVESGKFIFNNLPQLQDGVYQIIINNPIPKNNKFSIHFLNIIIDNSEKHIVFNFNPTIDPVPTFSKSEINKNWAEFLRLQNFRLATIEHIKSAILNGNTSNLAPPNKFEDILQKEISDFKQIRQKYIKSGFNKWSKYLAQNTPISIKFDNVTKDNFWNQFDTNNPDLINTPIYQELIQYYVSNYYNNANEDQYIEVFQKVIEVFSKDNSTKEWVVKYIITGLYRLQNDKLSQYFSKKYGYKI